MSVVETAIKPRFCWWVCPSVNCSPRGWLGPVALHLLRSVPFVFFIQVPHVLMLAQVWGHEENHRGVEPLPPPLQLQIQHQQPLTSESCCWRRAIENLAWFHWFLLPTAE